MFLIVKYIFIIKNVTDFSKTVETGVNPSLCAHCCLFLLLNLPNVPNQTLYSLISKVTYYRLYLYFDFSTPCL